MDANKLRSKIAEQGLSIAKLSELTGIHKSSMYRKINGRDSFTVSDAVKIKNSLGLTNLETLDIFLSRGNDQ